MSDDREFSSGTPDDEWATSGISRLHRIRVSAFGNRRSLAKHGATQFAAKVCPGRGSLGR